MTGKKTKQITRRSFASSPATGLAMLGLAGVSLFSTGAAFAQNTEPPTPLPTTPATPSTPVSPSTPASPPVGTSEAPPTVNPALPAEEPAKPSKDGKPEEKPGTAAGPATERQKKIAEKYLGSWAKDIDIHGGWSTRYMANDVTGGNGAQQLFNDQNLNFQDYRSVGPLQQNMDLTIQGKVFNAFSVNARLTNSRYGNYYNQAFGFNYRAKGTSIDLGNVSAALPGNSLVTFQRSLEGIMFSRDFGGGRVRMTGIASLTRAVTRRGTFLGQNTNGPYYMNASNIVEGSEKVRLNGQDLQGGVDYTIDYLLGQISFPAGKIITPSDTVEFTYESRNYNTQPGFLTGTRWDFATPQGHAYGLTYVQQKSSGSRVGNGTVTERFPVMQDTLYRYQLSSLIDATVPVRIRHVVQGELTEGIDFVLNRDLHYFQLKRPFPPDTSLDGIASLQVTYLPLRQNSLGGDRQVIGLDTNLNLGDGRTVGLQFGRSEGTVSSQSGTAMMLSANLRSPKGQTNNAWTFTTGYKSVGEGFSTIDSVSSAFLQAEKGLQTSFSIAPNSFYTIKAGWNESKVANQSSSTSLTSTPSAIWTNNQDFSTGVNLQFPSFPSIELAHRQTVQKSLQAGGTGARFTSDTLGVNWTRGIVSLTTQFGRTASRGRSVFSSSFNNSVVTQTGSSGTLLGQYQDGSFQQFSGSESSSLTSRYQVQLRPAEWIDLTTDFGTSRTTAISQSSTSGATNNATTARNLGIMLGLRPLPRMDISANFIETTNGQSTAGYYNAAAQQNGSGGVGSQLGNLLGGQKTRSNQFTLQYVPWERMTLNMGLMRSLSLVPGWDNTENNTFDLGTSITPFSKLQTTIGYMNQKVRYVGGQGNSNNRSLNITGTVGPYGKMSFTTMWSRMNFGSAVYSRAGYSGSAFGVGGNVSGVGTSGTGVGGLGSGVGLGNGLLQQGTNTSWTLQTDYEVGKNRSLFARWRAMDQWAPDDAENSGTFAGASSSYRAASNYRQGTGTVGFDWRFSEIMGFTAELNLLNLNDRQDSRYSYKARTFNMDLSARF